MANSTSPIPAILEGTGAIGKINEYFDAASNSLTGGRNAAGITGLLKFALFGGRRDNVNGINTEVTLTASTTNYIVWKRSDGVISVSTSTTNWNDSTNYYRLYSVVTGTTSVTSYTDERLSAEGIQGGAGGGGGGMANPMTTTGDIIYSGSGSTPARLGVGTNGYVLTLAAGLPTWAPSSGGGFANPMTTAGDIIYGGASGLPTRLAAGTSSYVLTSNGAGVAPSWQAAAGGGGLTGFTSTLNTASPNATTNASSLFPSGGTTDQDGVYGKKGSGAIQAQVADSGTAGGNRRGGGAVDWQQSRNASTKVASGTNSVIGGGQHNTASGTSATVAGGNNGLASGAYSHIGGGRDNTASGDDSTIAGGYANVTDGIRSFVMGGARGNTRGIESSGAHGCGVFNVSGDSQGGYYVQRIATAGATPTALSSALSSAAPTATTACVLPNNSCYAFEIRVAAKATGSVNGAGFKISGTIIRGANAASTVFAGTPTVTALGATAGASAWTVVAVVNTTLGSLEVQVTGVAATAIQWVAYINTTENVS